MDTNFEVSDTQSLEIINRYLQQLSGHNEHSHIINTVESYLNTNTIVNPFENSTITNDNHIEPVNTNTSKDVPVDGINKTTEINYFEPIVNESNNTNIESNIMAEINLLRLKIELENELENKIKENIKNQKCLLQITQEKMTNELKLLELINKRQLEEAKLIQNRIIQPESNNLIEQLVLTPTSNINSSVYQNENVETDTQSLNGNLETKVTKRNSAYLRNIKRS